LEFRLFFCPRHEIFGDAFHSVHIACSAVLDPEFKTGGGSEAGDGRRVQGQDKPLPEAEEHFGGLIDDRRRLQILFLAFFIVQKRNELQSRVGFYLAVQEAVAVHLHDIFNSRLLCVDASCFLIQILGAVQAGGVGQNGDAEKVALIFRRHEA